MRTIVPRPLVLAVDDEAHVRAIFRDILDREFDVIEASDGAAALDLIDRRRVNVMLLDLLMDGIDGLNVLERLRSMPRRPQVIVVTAVAGVPMAVTAMKLGAVDYLTKPFEVDALTAAVRKAAATQSIVVAGDDVGLRAAVVIALRAMTRAPVTSLSSRALRERPAAHTDSHIVDLTVGDVARLLATVPDVSVTSRCGVAIIEHVARCYSSATAHGIGSAVGASPDHLTESFRRETGMGLKEYVLQVRVEVATYLITETPDKLDVIAERVGFCDAPHLCRLFQRYRGETPGAYRARGYSPGFLQDFPGNVH